jgi:hypothetical protein
VPAGWSPPCSTPTQGAASNDTDSPPGQPPECVGCGCAEPGGHALGRFGVALAASCTRSATAGAGGLTSGNVNDTRMLGATLTEIRIPRRGPGRPRPDPIGAG